MALQNAAHILYVDGSSRKDPLTHETQMGYAVVTDQEILESSWLPGHLSAQAVELYVLTGPCILAEGQTVTIHTDSCYASGVVYLEHFGEWEWLILVNINRETHRAFVIGI